MLPFGSKLAVAGSLLASGDAAVVRNAPRSTVGCVELDSSTEYFYMIASTSDDGLSENIRLGVAFPESGELALVDQGYLKLTYDQDLPEGYTLAETQENDGLISSYEADGNEVILQLADSRSGQSGQMWFLWNHASTAATFTSLEYCVAPSPTANIPTYDEVSDVNLCEEVELGLAGNFNCRACSTMGAYSAPLVGSYDDGDYLEVFTLQI